jgi:large subunit ribosomal protein L9
MELILLKPVRKLGAIGDIVNVAQGFGRNFLLPKNLAVRATARNKKDIAARKDELAKESLAIKEKASKDIQNFIDKHFTFIKQSSYEGNLYGSLTAKEIASVISNDSIEIKPDNVCINTPIKKLGLFEVILSLHPEVECKIFINVVNSQQQADELHNSNETDSQTA